MLFDSTLRRELARSFVANWLVLFTIVITMLLIRTLGLASKGSVNPAEIVLVLTYSGIAQMPFILTISLFVAIVSTLSRWYADSEIFVWFAAGLGLWRFFRPIWVFAAPICLAIAGLVLWAWPWANHASEMLRLRYEQRGDLERVSPGQFIESRGGQRVFFMDRDSEQQKGQQIFIANTPAQGPQTLLTARTGALAPFEGANFLWLRQGQRLEFSAPDSAQPLWRISEFAVHGFKTGDADSGPAQPSKAKTQSSWHLWQQPTPAARGELAWRLGLVLSALNFVGIAVAVSAGNPRSGRAVNLALMLFSFMLYYNLINVGSNLITQGKVDWRLYMLCLHGSAFLGTFAWLAQQNHPGFWHPRRWGIGLTHPPKTEVGP